MYLWYTDTIKKEYFNVTLPVYTRWLTQQPNGEFPSGGNLPEIVETLRVKSAAAHGLFCAAPCTRSLLTLTLTLTDH